MIDGVVIVGKYDFEYEKVSGRMIIDKENFYTYDQLFGLY